MPEVRIGSEIKTYPQGTAYAEIAEEYQKNYGMIFFWSR